MGGGPEFSYEWKGKFKPEEVVKTPDGWNQIWYGFYFQGREYYRMADKCEYPVEVLEGKKK